MFVAPVRRTHPFTQVIRSGLHSHAHAAHAAAHAAHAAVALFVGDVGDHGFGGEHQAGDRGCVLQSVAGDLCGVDDAGCDEVFELLGRGVKAVAVLRLRGPCRR